MARGGLAAAFMLLSISLAAAQPKIPPSEMPGRERERFIDSPVERLMKPGPYVAPAVIDTVRPKRKCSRLARQRKRC